ncbi:MAG: glutamine synthetase family protein [Candidatus Rokuibacteriota bacterium]
MPVVLVGDLTLASILHRCRKHRVRLVRFLYCGLDGVVRGRACHVDVLKAALTSGIAVNAALLSCNSVDRPVTDSPLPSLGSLYLVPALESFAVLPYVEGCARVHCDLVTSGGTPFEACPRTFLRRMLARGREAGFAYRATFESEFFLLRPTGAGHVPLDLSPALSSRAMDAGAGVIAAIVEGLAAQGVPVEFYGAEAGHGQHELSIRFDDALRAADLQLAVRETTRTVAANRGFLASFAPKPLPDEMGNGSHIHSSLWSIRGRANLFHAPRRHARLSRLGVWFIGGILHHLSALVALTAPSVESYRRFVPRLSAGAYRAWGLENREAAVRIPEARTSTATESVNVEFRPCDASCNPYLALGALLAAGLDGIAGQRDPGPALCVDPNTLSDAELGQRRIGLLPASLSEALEHLETDDALATALGPTLLGAYVALKRSELRDSDIHASAS